MESQYLTMVYSIFRQLEERVPFDDEQRQEIFKLCKEWESWAIAIVNAKAEQ